MSKVLLLEFPQLADTKFFQTDFGQLYQSIPFEQLASTIPPLAGQQSGKGCKPWFTVKGALGLMLLKWHAQWDIPDVPLIYRIHRTNQHTSYC